MSNKTNHSILVINSGSSSIKFQLFEYEQLHQLARGTIDNINTTPRFTATTYDATQETIPQTTLNLAVSAPYKDALNYILTWIEKQFKQWTIGCAAHRVVHGGRYFTRSVQVSASVMSQLKSLCPLAPLHQPHNLAAIELLSELRPGLAQIACFDTAFHSGHTRLFTAFALPETLRNQGIHRYGFHGLSYEWMAYRLKQCDPELIKGRVIGAHLGNGASLCAMQNGVSVDTTMGMTALDGLPMGTRCGHLDPGVLLYLIQELKLSTAEVEHLLYQESGLKGLSGWTHDVRLLQASDNKNAQFAIDYFCMKSAQFIAMMAVALGGIDGLVFTGGIGENSALIRDQIASHLAFLKPFEIRTIQSNEERIMAIHATHIMTA